MKHFYYFNFLFLIILYTTNGSEIYDREKRQITLEKEEIRNKPIKYYVEPKKYVSYVKKVLDHISNSTCIEFKKSDKPLTEVNLLIFKIKPVKQGKNDKYNKSTSQEVIVNKSCFKTFACLLKYTVLKLGMTAPHHRKDRDNYVEIHSNNYKSKKYFEIFDDSKAKTFGTGYDFGSITNEKETYKSKNGKSTIEPKQEKYKFMMGYSKSLSFNDVKILNYMYCDDKCKDSPIRCENGGYPDYKDCTKCICPEGFKGKKCIEIDTDYDSCIYTEIGVFEEEKIFKQRVYRYDTYSRCVHKFSSIIGTRIQMSINVITSNKTECVESDFELKYQKDKGATGLKICGDYFNNTTNILSEDNKVLLIFKRYGRNDIEIKYKAVKTVN